MRLLVPRPAGWFKLTEAAVTWRRAPRDLESPNMRRAPPRAGAAGRSRAVCSTFVILQLLSTHAGLASGAPSEAPSLVTSSRTPELEPRNLTSQGRGAGGAGSRPGPAAGRVFRKGSPDRDAARRLSVETARRGAGGLRKAAGGPGLRARIAALGGRKAGKANAPPEKLARCDCAVGAASAWRRWRRALICD